MCVLHVLGLLAVYLFVHSTLLFVKDSRSRGARHEHEHGDVRNIFTCMTPLPLYSHLEEPRWHRCRRRTPWPLKENESLFVD